MATLTKWAIFMRAFMSALVAGTVYSADKAEASEQVDWTQVQRTGTPEAFFLYLRRHPRGDHVTDALAALSTLGALDDTVAGEQIAQGFRLY